MNEDGTRPKPNHDLRGSAEERVRAEVKDEIGTPEARSTWGMDKLNHELQLHKIELDMQNDELRYTNDRLDISRARYRALYDLAPVGYLTVDESGVILEANLRAIALLEMKRDDLARRSFASLVHVEDRDGYERLVERLVARGGEETLSVELRMLRSNNAPLWAHLGIVADTSGDPPPRVLVAVTDISARKLAEEKSRVADAAARTAVRRLQGVMDTAPVAICMAFDPQCRRIVGNARAHALLGIPMGENVSAAPGGSEDTGYVVARGGKAVTGQELPMQFAARTGNSTIEEELEIVRKDGSRITILMSAAPLRDESGAVVGSVGTFQDITGRKRTEDALESSLLEKDVLMRELAHRTKNNMQVIGSLITLQAAALGDRKFVDALKDTKDRIRAMALVHENIYRSDNLASLGMNGYARDLISSLLRAHRGRNGTVTPVFDIEDIPIPVDAAVALGLIINELTTNSLKHAFSGGKPGMIRLAIRRDGEGVEVRYGDDGPGLPPGIDVSRCRTLGLKIVHGIAVLQLRGKMEVRGEPMPGFVFRFAGFSHMEGKAE